MIRVRRSMRQLIGVAAAGVLTLCAASARDVLEDKVLRAAVVPDADFVVTSDAAAWQESPIQKTLDAIYNETEARAPQTSESRLIRSRIDALIETLGLTRDDVTGLVVSARVRALQLEAGAAPPADPQEALERLGLVAGIRLRKPVDMGKLRIALGKAAGEEGIELMFEKADYKGASVLSVVRPDRPGKAVPWMPRSFMVALLDGGEAVVVGTEAAVKAALDRFAGAAPAPLTDGIRAARTAAMQGAMSSAFFVPSDGMRALARDRGAAMQNGGNPMVGNAVQALAGLQHIAIDSRGTDRLSVQVGAGFTSAEQAQQVKSMLDVMVLAMIRMALMQAVGRPIPLIESLTSRLEGAQLAVVADLTEEDLKAVVELAAKGALGAQGAPPQPGGGPAGIPAPQPAAPAN